MPYLTLAKIGLLAILVTIVVAVGGFFLAPAPEAANQPPETVEVNENQTDAAETASSSDLKTGHENQLDNNLSQAELEVETYQESMTDEGVIVDRELEIKTNGSKQQESSLNINNGQVISNTQINATGTTIIIKESQHIEASSSQSVSN
jgi:hypothetical protein